MGIQKRKKQTVLKVSEFKSRALRYLDETFRRGSEYVITRKGVPIAQVIPMQPLQEGSCRGSMKDILEIPKEIYNIDLSDEWDLK